MDIILYHHLGIGDHFICNALVLEVAKKYNHLHLISKTRYYLTVKHLYSDYNNITVHPVANTPPQDQDDVEKLARELNLAVLMVGFQHCDLNNFESSFYRQLGLDIDLQYTGFSLPSDLNLSRKLYNDWCQDHGNDYIFVHDTSSVGKFNLHIKCNLTQYRVERHQTHDVIDYVTLICNAREIHVINSGIQALVWPMFRQGLLQAENIYYHDTRSMVQGGVPVRVPKDPKITIVEYQHVIDENLSYQKENPSFTTKKYDYIANRIIVAMQI